MRGFFGIGVEGISKEQNVGTIARSAHSFGSSFFFTVDPDVDVEAFRSSDTSDAFYHMPYYQYKRAKDIELPEGCALIGVEFVEESIPLPSFRHPLRAAYILGPEMGNLSSEAMGRCDHIVKIPMKFCVNVGVAAAIIMYDRMTCLGKFAERPVRPGTVMKQPARQTSLRRKIRSKK
ncbi:MAG: rRNA methyltransferase [Micavibrio sp.]|nr:rRNA methyltransferase [Micavibrio sp.]